MAPSPVVEAAVVGEERSPRGDSMAAAYIDGEWAVEDEEEQEEEASNADGAEGGGSAAAASAGSVRQRVDAVAAMYTARYESSGCPYKREAAFER